MFSAIDFKPLISLLLLILVTFAASQMAYACGAKSDCVIGDRNYRVLMPEGHDGKTKVGAVFFMHGWRGSPKGIIQNRNISKAVSELGLALVAPKAAYDDWAIPGAPHANVPVELEFFDKLVEDLPKRFPIDTSRMMATGFSAGGMMTWTLACERSEMFAGFAPIAGTFWDPVPQSCSSPPAHLFHIHGMTDTMVPLTGRKIAHTKQGDVPTALSMYARHGNFSEAEDTWEPNLKFKCRELENEKGKVLELCLHPDGHLMRHEYITRSWNKLIQVGAFMN
ncbi:MAG: prolyl oligopeptidase family serine peptidase [Pseudomonadota bacterium]